MKATYDDPIVFELFRNALASIADEMALTIFRTAYSGVLKDSMDYSTAFCDADGRLVTQGLTVPAHLGSFPEAMSAILRRFDGRMEPGDIYCLNDPFEGGMHLPDVFIIKPIFHHDERIAFAGTICHQTDMGGRVAGSNASDSTEIYQEGLRLPPVKMYDAGHPNETLFAILEKNVRVPVKILGDMRAQLAACHIGEGAFLRLVARYGLSTVRRLMQELIDHTERMTRAALRQLPDGVFTFDDWIDDDGVDYGRPIPLKVTIRKTGERIVADWTGSSRQVRGAINSTFSYTKAATYTCIKSVLPLDIPNNEGFFRAIEVIAPPGTITNVILPGSTAARGLTGLRMVDCCFGALAMMLPDRVFAASDGGNTGISIGGYYADRSPFIFVDFLCSAWGGRAWTDGLEGNSSLFANLSSLPAEICELDHPIEILRFECIQDAGGPGKFRGGMSVRRDHRFLETEAVLQVRSDRRAFRPYGLYGGRPGRPSSNVINPETDNRVIPSKVTMMIRRGEVFRHEMAGGGGWGDPLEREPWRVLKDVRNELVSMESARRDYGVMIEPETWTINEGATAQLRSELLASRGGKRSPKVSR
jgi:N-methylhydantoinase B